MCGVWVDEYVSVGVARGGVELLRPCGMWQQSAGDSGSTFAVIVSHMTPVVAEGGPAPFYRNEWGWVQ